MFEFNIFCLIQRFLNEFKKDFEEFARVLEFKFNQLPIWQQSYDSNILNPYS